jgi:hypothetical protein
LLWDGVDKEVFVDGMDHPVTAQVYTMPEAARALGKSALTFKRWVKDRLIPPPVLQDTVNGYRHYSRGEMDIICELIHQNSNDYSYVTAANDSLIHSLWQRLEHYRRTSI